LTVGPPPSDRLPDGFPVRLDPAVQRRDGGATLLGGSPLRLMRLSARAQALLADRLSVRDATTAELAARLLDAGMAVPEPCPRRPDDVTVVIPVRDRPRELARLLAALRADPSTAGLPVIVVDDGSAEPVVAEGTTVLRHPSARGPAAARNTGLRAAATATVAFLDSDCVPHAGWLDALVPHLDDPRLALVAPRIVGLPAARATWLTPYEDAVSALDMGQRPAAVRPLSAVSYVPSAALLARRAALDESMRVAEDVDLVWRLVAAGWRVRYEPAALVAHEHPAAPSAWLRRRAFYGTGAALLAARHGSAVAPLVISPSSAAVWLLLLAGRRGLLPAAGLLAVASGRLARRLRRPGAPVPAAFAAGLVLRGTATAGTTLARSVTRHHWPLALLAALVSRRARRLVLATALADAALAWWPHRAAVGLLRFAAARRLEDLAYGTGLWAGALRARDPRALLPAVPPRF
jgi:mycofactocin system glycosyltransferase